MRRPVVFCFVAAAIALGSVAQTPQLNPTVSVVPKAQSLVPTDCDVGLAPAPPRALIAEIAQEAPATVTVTNLAPPSGDLRTHLRRIQSAAENEYYETFKTALSDARLALSGYPGGGEKQAAEEVLRVYGDLERLWDFAFNTPTGAFFDASSQNGALLNAMRRYPAFPRAVAGATLTIDGQPLYPSRETRLFLVDEAARRLGRLGVRTPSRVIVEQPSIPQRTPRIITTEPMPRTPTYRSRTTGKKSSAGRTRKRPSTQIAEATPKRPPRRRAEEPIFTPIPPTPPVQPPTEPVTTTVAPPPAPVTRTTAALPPPTETTESTATSATTATTATTTTTTRSATEKPAKGGGMNLTFAIILIVIGIGVLIVLFRASD